jgi:hypothetical protein
MEKTQEASERSTSLKHMVPVKPNCGQALFAVNVEDIISVCLCAKVSDTLCFVSTLPNGVEKE